MVEHHAAQTHFISACGETVRRPKHCHLVQDHMGLEEVGIELQLWVCDESVKSIAECVCWSWCIVRAGFGDSFSQGYQGVVGGFAPGFP